MAYNSGCQRNIKIKLLHFLYHYNTFRARAPTYLLPLLDTPVQSWQLAWPSPVSSHPKAREVQALVVLLLCHMALRRPKSTTVPNSSVDQCSYSSRVSFASGCRPLFIVMCFWPAIALLPTVSCSVFVFFSHTFHRPRSSPVAPPPSGGTGRHRGERGSPQRVPPHWDLTLFMVAPSSPMVYCCVFPLPPSIARASAPSFLLLVAELGAIGARVVSLNGSPTMGPDTSWPPPPRPRLIVVY